MIRNVIGRSGLIGAAMVLAGCANTVPPSESREVTEARNVTEVVNLVKKELVAYDRYRLENPVGVKSGRCSKDSKSDDTMDLKVSSATLVLSAVANRGRNVSLVVPVFPLNYTGSYSKSRTQTLTIPLDVVRYEPSNEMQGADDDHSVAKALENFRREILSVDHDDYLCSKVGDKKTFKVLLQLDVVKNQATGVTGVQFVRSRIGAGAASAASTDEAHQTLAIEMNIVGKGDASPYLLEEKTGKGRVPRGSFSREKTEKGKSSKGDSSSRLRLSDSR